MRGVVGSSPSPPTLNPISLLFDAGYLAFAAASAPWWLRKSRSGWAQRFGKTATLPAPDPARPRLLIHAVSVGEASLLRPLIRAVASDFDLVIASTTDTGAARARDLYAHAATLVRYPLDASWAVRRFLDAVRPDAVALVELELWPTFARECRRRGVPLCILNGRLSDRSFPRYRRALPLLRDAFAGLTLVAAQDETYASRFTALGVPRDRVRVVGTMKWDAAEIADDVPGAPELAREMGIDRSRPLIVAGSTAPDEHALLHGAMPPGVQLLCAPRKPEWFDAAAADLPGCARRSSPRVGSTQPGAAPARSDRFLLDTIGELRKAYALADLVVVGRSFGDLYGSDPMEPAALGKPIVIGPSVDDFRSTVDAMRRAGAIVQTTREGLASDLARLLHDGAARAELARRARECVLANQGATARTIELLRAIVGPNPPAEPRRDAHAPQCATAGAGARL